MNERGQYGRTAVGSSLRHVLELRQRYDSVSTGAFQALLNSLGQKAAGRRVSSTQWEYALRDETAWVSTKWYPDLQVLEVTITDKQPYVTAKVAPAQIRFEQILARDVTPALQRSGATMVGITLYHSVGDRADAVKQMALDWSALFQDLAVQAGEITLDPSVPSGVHFTTQTEFAALAPDPMKVAWWKFYAKPLFQSWAKFRIDQLGGDRTVAADYIAFAERWKTNWDVYESWHDKLEALRAAAKKVGFTISVPSVHKLPTTVWADVEDAAKNVASGAGDALRFVKYAAYGVLGIGAIVALSSVAQNLRSGKDPAAKYTALLKNRRPRAAALPRAPMLELTDGSG